MNTTINAFIPMAIQIVIDDVGWWSGENGSEKQEPYRTGFVRNHVSADYMAIVELGRKLNMRPQAAMVLSEWDSFNAVAKIPSCSKFGNSWDNSKWVGDWLSEAAQIIRENKENFEIALHGISHEYWVGGKFTRGEWYDKEGILRPRDVVLQRLDLFRKILDDHRLGAFPESYVPTAFVHHFRPDGENLFEIFADYGIKYCSTPYSTMINAGSTENKYFGLDRGIITVDRGRDVLNWNLFDKPLEKDVSGPICGMHWPNILHEDPKRNSETVDRWVQFLKPYDSRLDRMLAENTEAMCAQLIAHLNVPVILNADKLVLSHPVAKFSGFLKNGFWVKFDLAETDKFVCKNVKIMQTNYDSSGHLMLKLKFLNENDGEIYFSN